MLHRVTHIIPGKRCVLEFLNKVCYIDQHIIQGIMYGQKFLTNKICCIDQHIFLE